MKVLKDSKICVFFCFGGYCKITPEIKGDYICFKRCPYFLQEYSKCHSFCPKPIKPIRRISKVTRYEVLDRQGWYCNHCHIKLKYDGRKKFNGEVAHIDHIHPFSEWESYKGIDINEPSNLQALCPSCNMKKHAKNGF